MGQSRQNMLNMPVNRVGRDFVVGDVCGAFDLLFQAMQDANFDAQRDRLFSVGHLIHPDASLTDCVRFLRHPSVYAVRSNGEQQLLDLFEEGEPDDESMEALSKIDFHGLGWLAGTISSQRRQLVDTMRMLPLAITIGEQRSSVGLVHAGVPLAMPWNDFSVALSRDDEECVQAALHGAAGMQIAAVAGVGSVLVCYTPEWDVTHSDTNMLAVLPGPYLLPLQAAIAEQREE